MERPGTQTENKRPEYIDIKLMSFNSLSVTTSADDLSWDSRRESVFRMLKDVAPDLVGMQECSVSAPQIVEAIPDYALYKMPFDPANPKATQGPVILYNTKTCQLLDSGFFWLGPTPDSPCLAWDATDTHYRVCTWVKVKVLDGDKTVYLYDTHLPYKGDDHPQRLKSAELIMSRMKANVEESSICFLVGDLNQAHFQTDGSLHANAYCLQPFFDWMKEARETAVKTDRYGSHSAKAANAPVSTPNYDLDHIFYRNAQAVEFKTIINTYGVRYLSDHYPITLRARIGQK